MEKKNSIAPQTRNNWLIDSALLISALVASISGIYFLFLPVGGFQGGRNPMYGVTVFFGREIWDDFHTWFGIGMIVVAVVHIVVHWQWIVRMGKRIIHEIIHRETRLNKGSRFNLLINFALGLGFILVAISGVYLLFVPGGRNAIPDPQIIFTRTTWDLIHSWSGIVMIAAAVIHFSIHWRWVNKVSRKMVKSTMAYTMPNRSPKNINA